MHVDASVLLAVLTLFLGSAWTNFIKRGELLDTTRLQAGDLLAELQPRMWNKEPEGWLDLNQALDRLSVRLRLAGVPSSMTRGLAQTAREFWRSLNLGDGDYGEQIWWVEPEVHDRWTGVSGIVSDYLGTRNPLRRLALRWRWRGHLRTRSSALKDPAAL